MHKVLIPSLCAPFLGMAVALVFMLAPLDRRAALAGARQPRFRVAAARLVGFLAFTHGTNDAQKTMGIIALALVASGHLDEEFTPPIWVIVSAAPAIAAGTYAGGWRIIRTLGTAHREARAPQGFAAETGLALFFFTAHYGFPVSTTHTISGSVLGAGATRGLSAVRWGVAGNILTAWLLTIPAQRSSGPHGGRDADHPAAP